ncbi:MAG: phospholipid carrier-dependent glycosyltransferase, partial [Microgenomates group bacterium]
YLTINAFNFWSLHPNLSWIPDATSVLSIPGKTLGLVLFLGLSLVSLIHWRKTDYNPKYIPRLAATILILFFTFTTRMHERHLLFGLPFLSLAVITESWLIIPLLIFTLTFTLNLYGAYFWVVHNQAWPFSLSIISLISWVTTLTSIFLATVWSWPKSLKYFASLLCSNLLLVLILTIATALRFINLSNPPSYIFDEVYHAFTAREYLHNHKESWEWWTTPPKDVAYEWTHPPVAKYGMVVGMLLFGEDSTGWRVGSAMAGVISIFGLYLLVTALTKNKNIALLSAFFLSIEGLHIAQSRLAMNDMYMLVFLIFALYCAVKSRWKLSAVLYGLSMASKWSALYGIIPLLFIFFRQYGFKKILLILKLIFITVLVYILTFTPFILAGHTWPQWWELHRQMWYYHTHLVATHAYQSTPLQWVFDLRPVWYYVKYDAGVISNIYALGNPIIFWLGLLAIILGVRKIFTYPYSLFLSTYAILTIPWIFSPRIMFFYHYLPSATFLCIILASWLAGLPPRLRNSLMVLCFIGLIIISPMLYAIPMPNNYWNILFSLIPSWK